MDEEKVNQTLNNGVAAANNATGSTTTATTTTSGTQGLLSDEQRIAEINRMYDSNMNAQRTALQEAGDQALSDAQANRDKIAQQYQTQRNMAAVDWERQRRNFLEGANMNGINTGANSQAQLAMMGQQQRAQNTLGYQQAQAEGEADRNIADIRRQTQADINEALAKNDYQRAAALLDEYNQMYTRALTRAQTLSQYGDFSGYSNIYGEAEAQNMANNWYAKNPDLAYMTGSITGDQRDNLLNGLPMNYGLDANGNRIRTASSGGVGYYGSNKSQADIVREQANNMKWIKDSSGNYVLNPGTTKSGTSLVDLADSYINQVRRF